MKPESDETLGKARSLPAGARSSEKPGGSEDLGELFVAHLRMRRAELREWIEALIREAGAAAGPAGVEFQAMTHYTCRGRRVSAIGPHKAARRKRPAAARPV